MEIALIGYGRMGKIIEQIAIKRGHTITAVIDINTTQKTISELKDYVDIAIEFTTPLSAQKNIYECLQKGISVVSGTTGWDININEIKKLCKQHCTSMFYASNFSIGMNIFMEINKNLSTLINKIDSYSVSIEEIHHIHKLDKPSGTAITLADGIIKEHSQFDSWELAPAVDTRNIEITSVRKGEIIGEHKIIWENDIDQIIIEHKAKSRNGFALGAVLAAEYINNKKGFFTMNDLLNL
ncbi:4-hydroxy-tetrahydrodipicolinate reductase [Bacteroidales bacterium OttesenSCG-928-I21]|nr:4-hydroxy-tetrahydrodipicolinate reductase [Bacteroidales bacterium OttesenSCG-928-I21]